MIAAPSDRDRLDADVLEALYAASAPLTPHQLARQLPRSESGVRESLRRLRDAGCVFDEHPQHGVRLIEAGLGAWRIHLSRSLDLPETSVHVYRCTSSTQDRARENVKSREGPGTHVVVADEQAAGRGRLGRRWHAPAGASLLLTVTVPMSPARARGVEPITAYAAVALLEAIQRVSDIEPALKWPNDAVLAGRKLAGILVERFDAPHGSFVLIGIGLNVNRPDTTSEHRAGAPDASSAGDAAGCRRAGRVAQRRHGPTPRSPAPPDRDRSASSPLDATARSRRRP